MSITKLKFLRLIGACTLAGLTTGAAAGPKHDLYMCVLLSGQGQVMGGRPPALSGVYRSTDRLTAEHVGFGHIRMFTVIADPRAADGLYLTALNGVVHSPDRGKTWHILTGWDMTEPKGIALDPHAPDHIYAGLPDGIAMSRDRGQTWQRMNAGIRRSYTHTITVDRTQAGRVLAGTELGIFLTEDGARTWRLVQATDDVTYDLRQSPHDPKAFLAVTASDGALWSADAGRTWRRIEGVPTTHTLHNGDFDPADARRLVLCGWEAGVQVSEDGGRTWSDRTAGLPNRQVWSVAVDPDQPARLYAAPYLQPVYVSDDFGRTWRPLFFEKATVYGISFVARP
ncbi:MAG: hypothetical protein EXS32_04830 [Opitutus sp.]|nr:hypothetical protein [Opitutus sp.]